MHELSEFIEEKGELPVVCPSCGVAWDHVKFHHAAATGEGLAEMMEHIAAQSNPVATVLTDTDGALSPLAQMMLDNTDKIDATIEGFGPGMVANWFMNTGAAIAALYGLTATGDDAKPFSPDTGDEPKTCSSCSRVLPQGSGADEVEFRTNPYQQDVFNDPSLVWLCGDCANHAQEDI